MFINLIKAIAVTAAIISGCASAHSLSPPEQDIQPFLATKKIAIGLHAGNARTDVEKFRVYVFDEDRNPVKFASLDRLFLLRPGSIKDIVIYVQNNKQMPRTLEICTQSIEDNPLANRMSVTSRVCVKANIIR